MLLAYLRARFAREEGQALVEYALILSLIAVAAVVILKTMGGQISGIFSTISSSL
jgi:pilus assembly protein Flp/PilA